MKLKDDDVAHHIDSITPSLRRRRIIVLTVCPACSLLLMGTLIYEGLPNRDDGMSSKPLTERIVDTMEDLGTELATGSWPASKEYGKVPCAINVSGYECPGGYGTVMNNLYMLEAGSSTGTPSYRSLAGYWLVHSPHGCFSQPIWLISRTRPDARADTHMCDLEAHISHSAALPVGNLPWSYVSCGTAGDSQATRRWLMLEPVRQCDCPTAGDASETEPAPLIRL
jgi:hypothetical protein